MRMMFNVLPQASLLIFFLFIHIPNAISAESSGVVSKKISIPEAIRLGLLQNDEIKAEKLKIDQAEADIERVHGEFSTKVEGKAGVGPINKIEGNTLSTVENKHSWGPAYITSIELTRPIFTWGRKSDYLDAAELGKKIKSAEWRGKKTSVRYQIKEAYYGALFAKSMLEFIREGKKDIERLEEESHKITKEEQYQLDIFKTQIEIKEVEAEKGLELALDSLQLRIGSSKNEKYEPKEDWIEPEDRTFLPLQSYLEKAQNNRLEYAQLENGIVAKKKLAKAEEKALWPVFGLMVKYDFGYTKMRTDQKSAFAYDPYNHSNLLFGLGIIWDFNWGLPQAKAEKNRAEAAELEAKQAFAKNGLALLVKKAWLDVAEAEKRLKFCRKNAKTAKKWLNGVLIGAGTGLGNKKKIVEAYQARAYALKEYYEAIFRQHMAWASLSEAVGAEIDPLFQTSNLEFSAE